MKKYKFIDKVGNPYWFTKQEIFSMTGNPTQTNHIMGFFFKEEWLFRDLGKIRFWLNILGHKIALKALEL